MLLNLAFIYQQEVAIHLFHNFIIKEFNDCEPRAKLPPSVKGKEALAAPAPPMTPAPMKVCTFFSKFG